MSAARPPEGVGATAVGDSLPVRAGHRAVVLLAHGSRDPSWPAPIEAIAQRMRVLRPDVPVACAFLESMQPDLRATVQALAAAGTQHITVVPMFLGLGRHTRQDLPERVDEVARLHPGIRFHVQPAVSEDPAVAELLAHTALAEPAK
jgi:sirohydrochlorin cobaltochelatase